MGSEYIDDIAVFTGATLISPDQGIKIEKCDPVYVMGKADKVQISKDRSIFIKG